MDRLDAPLPPDGPPARAFGGPPPNAPAPSTVTAHAIIVDGDRVLVVDDHQRFALPGGTPADGEPATAFLSQVVQEATGHEPADLRVFQRAHHWPDARGSDVGARAVPGDGVDCWFFVADLPAGTDLPAGGNVRWAPRDAALDLLDDPPSRWALSVALCASAVLEVLGTSRGTSSAA